ncbi:phage holin, partial [Escherichia coli]|uniref:phage holin n=1 Tax=Escherichia coli TaxID=562 RepID=UPI000B3F2233
MTSRASTTAEVGTGYRVQELFEKVSGVLRGVIDDLGSMVFGFLTYMTNLYFKIREDRREA